MHTRPSLLEGFLAAGCAALVCFASRVHADDAGAPSTVTQPERVVITARPISSDEEVAQRVQAALHRDPFLDDSRLTVHVANGVVRLEGIVLDDWDLRRAVRISGRADGVKRVIDDLDLHRMGDD
jgi:osmotically-inducible protein OsmY